MTRSVFLAIVLIAGPVWADESQMNVLQNSHFRVYAHGGPLIVPSSGAWFPEAWRITPSVGGTIFAVLETPESGFPSPTGNDQDNTLYIRWIGGQYDPFHSDPPLIPGMTSTGPDGTGVGQSYGTMMLEHYIFEFDQLAGHPVRLSFWMRIDGCCIDLIPAVWMNYADGDFQFLFAPSVLVTEQWTQATAIFQLPTGTGHRRDTDRYVAIGLTTPYLTAPGLHLAGFRLERLDVLPGTAPIPTLARPSALELLKLESDLAGLRDALTDGAGIVEGFRLRVKGWEVP